MTESNKVTIENGYKIVFERGDDIWDWTDHVVRTRDELLDIVSKEIINGFDINKTGYCGSGHCLIVKLGKVVEYDGVLNFIESSAIEMRGKTIFEEAVSSDIHAKNIDEKLRKEDIKKLLKEKKLIEEENHKDYFKGYTTIVLKEVEETEFVWQDELAKERLEEIEEELRKLEYYE
jgi:hypothetical protein